jgi:hypothetical protein
MANAAKKNLDLDVSVARFAALDGERRERRFFVLGGVSFRVMHIFISSTAGENCHRNFARFGQRICAHFGMAKVKARQLKPLEEGQVWRMAELNLKVEMVGKLLVHYKLAKPDAVRIPNLVNSKVVIEKYLKKNKAVLVRK